MHIIYISDMKFEHEQYFISLNPDWDNPAYKMKL